MKSLAAMPVSSLMSTLKMWSDLGITWDHFQMLQRSKNYAAVVTKAFLGRDSIESNYDLARTILGKEFISPDEVELVRNITYGDELQQYFSRTLPSEEVLLWLRDNGFVLIPGPSYPMSVLQIHGLSQESFYDHQPCWWNNNQQFASDEKVTAQWLMLYKVDGVPAYRRYLLQDTKRVPNAADVCWGISVYKGVRNAWLLPRTSLKTSSRDADGNCIRVGCESDGITCSHGIHIDVDKD